ncbi:hypothetical protein, partial [Bifidobacterium apri]|uniref:hypothetical protein n=1 Tax=Bifidobacterium apri TaxID=1769423 RepID=UPI00197AAABC
WLLVVFSTRRCLVGFPGVLGCVVWGWFAWLVVVVYVVLLLPLAGRLPSGGLVGGCVVVV